MAGLETPLESAKVVVMMVLVMAIEVAVIFLLVVGWSHSCNGWMLERNELVDVDVCTFLSWLGVHGWDLTLYGSVIRIVEVGHGVVSLHHQLNS